MKKIFFALLTVQFSPESLGKKLAVSNDEKSARPQLEKSTKNHQPPSWSSKKLYSSELPLFWPPGDYIGCLALRSPPAPHNISRLQSLLSG